VAEVVPFRPVEEAEAHQNPTEVEVSQPTRRRVLVQPFCFCFVVLLQAKVLAVCSAAVGPQLQQVRKGQERWKVHLQRTSDRLAGHLLPRLKIVD
jgi:hypothetical protein